ncbi:ribosome silencing factor, partial [bacterium]|nr:ribosome silencing factor [bacterium]
MEDVDIFEMAKLVAKFSLDKKAEEVKILDLRPLTTVTDFFVVCSADSEPQVKAIADNIERKMLDEGFKVYHTEGYSNLNWVLLDY